MQIFSVRPSRGGAGKRFLRALLIGFGLVVALSGCSRGTQGIFATIEIEEKTSTSNLVDNASTQAVVVSSDRIFAMVGTKIFSRLLNGEWGEIGSPSGFSATALAGINVDGSEDGVVDEVYAAFYNQSATNYYLYELDIPTLEWNPVPLSVWNPNDGRVIDGMRDVHNRVLVSTKEDVNGSGELWSFGSELTDKVILGEFDGALTDAAWNGSSAVVVSGGVASMRHIGDLTVSGSLTVPPIADVVPGVTGVGVFPNPSDVGSAALFAVTTRFGEVYVSEDGTAGSWQIAFNRFSDRSFSDIEWVENVGILVVATSGNGYYEALPPSSEDYALSLTNDIASSYVGSELSTSSIARFRYYSGINTLFALTNGLGLWTGTYTSPGNPSWTWE